MQLERQPDESVMEHHKRIVFGKQADKTLADYDYTEIAPYVYGKEYSSDVCRRMLYGSRYTLELLENNLIPLGTSDDSYNEVLNAMEQKRIELIKEQQKLSDQRREFRKQVVAEGRCEHLESKLLEAAKALPVTIGDIGEVIEAQPHEGLGTDYSEAVQVLSDWHYGMTTDNIFNKYNIEICKARVKHVAQQAVKRISLHGAEKLHIVILGDLIHGDCHVSARVAAEEVACDQIMQSAELLAQVIIYMRKFLSGCVKQIVVHTTYGNHARVVQNKEDSVHKDNMERFIPWWLAVRFSEDDSITISKDCIGEFAFINTCGHEMCAVHGDLDGVKNSPRLLHTLMRKACDKEVDYILQGDKHHRESFEELGITSILCGSLCGTDDYAHEKRLYSLPEQLLLIMNNDGLDAEYRIKCNL